MSDAPKSRSAAERRALRRKQKILASAGDRMKVVSGEAGTSSTEARNNDAELDPALASLSSSGGDLHRSVGLGPRGSGA